MKLQRVFLLGLVGVFFVGLITSCAGDPRKNCNHPQHGQYMKEKMAKKRGF